MHQQAIANPSQPSPSTTGTLDGGIIQFPPAKLLDARRHFLQASVTIQDELTGFDTSMQDAIAAVYLIAELERFIMALENYFTRVRTSMECQKDALNEVGRGLGEVATEVTLVDGQLAKGFTPQETLPGWERVLGLANLPHPFPIPFP